MCKAFIMLNVISWLLLIIPICGLLAAWYGCVVIYQNQLQNQKLFLFNSITPGTSITTIHGQQGTVLIVLQHSVILEQAHGKKLEIWKYAISTTNKN